MARWTLQSAANDLLSEPEIVHLHLFLLGVRIVGGLGFGVFFEAVDVDGPVRSDGTNVFTGTTADAKVRVDDRNRECLLRFSIRNHCDHRREQFSETGDSRNVR